MSRTRIVILQMREIIYTAVFVGLGILLLIILFFMFWPDGKDENKEQADNGKTAVYEAGVYSKQMTVGDSVINLQVVLDEEQVKSVEMINLDDTVSAMYPLMKPSVESISNQLASGVSLDEVVLSDEGQYTEKMILNEVDSVLDEHKAK
ncbi:MAG: hypothetical protein K1W39_10120 [Lachnospiraceae bacterium]|jgi:cbb3-type cytochrome oxidase subunit 3|nr:hypothetical protein [Lachnospiraceae bacterium]